MDRMLDEPASYVGWRRLDLAKAERYEVCKDEAEEFCVHRVLVDL